MSKKIKQRSPAMKSLIKILRELNMVCSTCLTWQKCLAHKQPGHLYGLCSNLGFTVIGSKNRGGLPKVLFDTDKDAFEGPWTHREFGCLLYKPLEDKK